MVREQEQARGAQTFATIQIPPGPRLGNVVLEVEDLEQGLWRQGAVREPQSSSCRPTALSA